MSIKVQPLHDRVLVRPAQKDETTKGGIILTSTVAEKPSQGQVIALGTGKNDEGKDYHFTVKKGDTVMYGKYAGNEIDVDGEKLVVMHEKDILAILG
jgi:chaperonin GroES